MIDLHTHTTASDGVLTPSELVERARLAGVDCLAITDHDCIGGFLEARNYCRDSRIDLCLVSGIEFSCRWSGTTVHIVGLGVKAEHSLLLQGIDQLTQARDRRGEKIGERLAARGFHGALEGARTQAGRSQLGRPHFAQWMVEQGHVADIQEAFSRYLGQGRCGDVKAFWPELAEVVGWITGSGGVAVVAHPLKYRMTRMKLRRLVVDFKAAGGEAIEVVTGRQTRDQTGGMRRLASEYSLEASVGSDFHRDTSWGAGLGVETPCLDGIRGVWERWAVGNQAMTGFGL